MKIYTSKLRWPQCMKYFEILSDEYDATVKFVSLNGLLNKKSIAAQELKRRFFFNIQGTNNNMILLFYVNIILYNVIFNWCL